MQTINERLISIIIPCYNSEKTISAVVDEIVEVIGEKIKFEIILVNDGSSDLLWNIMKDIAIKHNPHVNCYRLAKNFGQHSALMAGYRACRGDIVIQMDDDGQSDPNGIFTLVEKIDKGYDVVFARYPEVKETLFRRMGSEFNRRMCISFLGMPKDIRPMSLSAIKRYVVDEIIRYKSPYPYVGGLMFRATSNICDVEINHRERVFGKSNYTLKKLFRLWLNGFTAFSVKPLEWAAITGTVVALAGFIFALIIIIRKLLGMSVLAGWSSMISIILIVGGLNMIMLGVVGEYIGRIYISLNNAPQYVIRDEFVPDSTVTKNEKGK